MCACRQKKSFLIKDILQDVKGKVRTYSEPPTEPLTCSNKTEVEVIADEKVEDYDEKTAKFNVIYEVQKELELSNMKVHLEQRRNTYPLYPTAIKANVTWPYRKDSAAYPINARQSFSYYSDPVINTDQMLRNQFATNRFIPHPFVRQSYGYDRVTPSWCNPWWGVGGRRKGGQVRFSATQTSALERRFSASKYLSPDERRALAASLRLSDRQVKTWFQNRRAKWRRTTPESADAGSPATGDEGSDDEAHNSNDD